MSDTIEALTEASLSVETRNHDNLVVRGAEQKEIRKLAISVAGLRGGCVR